MSNQAQQSDILIIKELIFRYLKNWKWFLLSGAVSLFIAVVYLLSTNTTFLVESTVLIRDDNNKKMFSELAILKSMGLESVKKDVEDELHILSSKNILSNALHDLDLTTNYYIKSRLKYIDLYPEIPIKFQLLQLPDSKPQQVITLKINKVPDGYKVKVKYGTDKQSYTVKDFSKPFKTIAGTLKLTPSANFKEIETYKIVSYSINTITDIYKNQISINTINKKSNAVKISTITDNPAKAQAILNKIVELYNLDAVVDKNIIASSTRDFVEKRLELLKTELLDVELSVESYKKKNSLTDISQQSELYIRTNDDYKKELSKIETQLNLVEYIDNHINDKENKYSLIPANLGISDGPLDLLIRNYNDALLQRIKINRTSNYQNPLISQLEEQINALRLSIITSISTLKDGLRISKRDLKIKENQYIGKIKDMPTQEREYIDIKRQQEIKNNLYVFLLQKREENALTLASTIPSAKTLDNAYVLPQPVAPKKLFVMLIALIIGILIPVGIIYIVDLLDQTIKNKRELQRLTSVPYLGSISISKGNEKIVVGEGNTTPVAEMFRLIRTNLQFMFTGKTSNVILITSAGSGEGKSFTALNLALSFALTNKKVALLGLDIRKPALAEYLNLNHESGISHYLSNENLTRSDVTLTSILHANLDVILAGPVPPNPTELLMSYRLDELLEELRENYDYIILDTAPIGIVSDTYLLNRIADNALFVCRQNYTPREATTLINEIYQKGSLRGMGIVLNGVDKENEYGYGYQSKK